MKKRFLFFLLGLLVLLAGCKSMSSMAAVEGSLSSGDYLAAVKAVEGQCEGADYKGKNRLLYYLDYGCLLHYAGFYEESNRALDQAEFIADELYAKSISRETGSWILNDNVKEYAGEEFELLYVHIFKCLNYIALDNCDDAMVEVRKANLKMELLENKYRKATDEYNRNAEAGARVPEADCHFHNSALSRYLGAILYRDDRSYDDARIESEWMERAFAEQGDVYGFNMPSLPALSEPEDKALLNVVAFSGLSPVKTPLNFVVTASSGILSFSATGYDKEYVQDLLGFAVLPWPGTQNINVIRFEIPILRDRSDVPDRIVAHIDGGAGSEYELELLENVNSIAKDTYRRKMPYTAVKTALRVIGKKVGSMAGSKAVGNASGNDALGILSGLLFDIAASATEGADTRGSFFLPAYASASEIALKPGIYNITLEYFHKGTRIFSDVHQGVEVKKGALNLLESFRF